MSLNTDPTPAPTAVITGASRGLGLALAQALARRGWRLVLDARDSGRLAEAVTTFPSGSQVAAVSGDVADPHHRLELAAAVEKAGRLDLLVNNASCLGPSPLRSLTELPLDVLEHVYAVNTLAPLALSQLLLPALTRSEGRIINVSSDAAVEAYPGWGGYGSSKAALDQLTAVLAAEQPHLAIYSVDPGDMNTDMHQQAFPGEDISDRPSPGSVVPALLRLIDGALASGRYLASGLAESPTAGATTPAADGAVSR